MDRWESSNQAKIGHGSKGLHIIESGQYLVSEFIEGDEYTVDCFRDDNTICSNPKMKRQN